MRLYRLRPLAGALLFGVCALAAPPPNARPSEELLKAVERSIRSEIRLRVYDWVGFQVEGSKVTLRGPVSLVALKRSIENRVLALPEIDSVENRLEILPRSGDDMGLRVNAYWRIYGNPELRRYARQEDRFTSRIKREADDVQRVLVRPIHIIVRDGHITLEGEVDQRRDAVVADAEAKAVMGVRSVENRLVVVESNTEERQAFRGDRDLWWKDASSVLLPTLLVENPSGRVEVETANVNRLRFHSSSPDREVRDGDVVLDELRRKQRLRCLPSDGARIDIRVELPYGYALEVETVDGPISIAGLFRDAKLRTASGAIEVAAPWEATRLDAESENRPDEVRLPPESDAPLGVVGEPHPGAVWRLTNTEKGDKSAYGNISIRARSPTTLALVKRSIPMDSPVQLHWQAPQALESMFRSARAGGGGLVSRATLPKAGADVHFESDNGPPLFSSDVRLVDLTVAATDEEGRPVAGLGPSDFEVWEEGERQTVRFVTGGDAPFNLGLLLDCSTSTLIERSAVVQAARRFVSVARRGDRVAVYVLADNYLQTLSELTENHRELLNRIEDIPPLSGSTPLYDAMVLAYAHELANRKWERNALIVISDGLDNQILPPVGRRTPSRVPYEDLLRASAEMNALIYPIFLDPLEPMRKSWERRAREWKEDARQRLEKLAASSGGRLFRATSIRSLEPVYRQVAQELRSVYAIGYYPKNQDFDGDWRNIEVRLKRPDVRIRTRPGYYAW